MMMGKRCLSVFEGQEEIYSRTTLRVRINDEGKWTLARKRGVPHADHVALHPDAMWRAQL